MISRPRGGSRSLSRSFSLSLSSIARSRAAVSTGLAPPKMDALPAPEGAAGAASAAAAATGAAPSSAGTERGFKLSFGRSLAGSTQNKY